jgi:anti-sigma factor RsiW
VISCDDAMRQLWGYLFDEVDPGNRHRIAEHLEACRRCCGEVAFLGELRRFVADARPSLPADVGVRMEAFLSTLEGPDDRPDVQG